MEEINNSVCFAAAACFQMDFTCSFNLLHNKKWITSSTLWERKNYNYWRMKVHQIYGSFWVFFLKPLIIIWRCRRKVCFFLILHPFRAQSSGQIKNLGFSRLLRQTKHCLSKFWNQFVGEWNYLIVGLLFASL